MQDRQHQATCDEAGMRRALRLARRGIGRTRPNPPVGAVVMRNGRILAEGYHRRAGGPHAEAVALDRAGPNGRGATLYVTLEPCSTQGRTPPCTEHIAAAGIARVVIGTPDPNPRHTGRGMRWLKRRGIAVTSGICSREAKQLVRPFAKWVTSGRPWVTLKMGMTLDGRVGDQHGASRWITCPASRARVQALRRHVDAVIVGSGTARADNPQLLCRRSGNRERYRVLVDSRGRTPHTARVLNDAYVARTVMATSRMCPKPQRERYQQQGAQVWVLPTREGRVSVRTLLRRLGRLGCLHVLCEGGGALAGSLMRDDVVDEFLFFVAPRVLGPGGVPVIGLHNWTLAGAPRLVFSAVEQLGDDVLLTAQPARPAATGRARHKR